MSTDVTLEDTIYRTFTTRAFATGIPGTLGGSPVVSAYENDSATQITAGITLGVDHDSVTGLNLLTIVATDANGYEDGKDYSLVITTGTVGGVSVVGEVVGEFTIGRSSASVLAAAIKVVTDQMVFTVANQLDVNALSIDSNSGAAARLSRVYRALDRQSDIASATSSTITFDDADMIGEDKYYRGMTVLVWGGTGSGQSRLIKSYDGPSKTATIVPDWGIIPDATSDIIILPQSVGDLAAESAAIKAITDQMVFTSANLLDVDARAIVGSNPAASRLSLIYRALDFQTDIASATASTITFDDAVMIGTTKYYRGMAVLVTAGTGVGQARLIKSYDGPSKTATIVPDWGIIPDATSDIVILPQSVGDLAADVGVAGIGLTNLGGMSTGMKAEVLAEVLAALEDAGLVLVKTTIATLASQVSFTLTAGSADADAYNEMIAVITDQSTGVQRAVGWVDDYAVTTKTITLRTDPGIFTMAVGDTISIIAVTPATDLAFAVWEELLTGATHNVTNTSGKILRQLQTNQGYLGEVHIDTIGGTAGTDPFEHGTIGIPVDNLADALTIGATPSVNFASFKLRSASSIQFISAITLKVFRGVDSWTLDLNGQDISNSSFSGAVVSGISSATGEQRFIDCELGAVTLPDDTHIERSWIEGIQTLLAGEYFYDQCKSHLAGPAIAPIFDFGGAIGDTSLNLRHYSGGVHVKNMGQTGTDTMTLEGDGQLIIDVNCVGGTIAYRGDFKVTDNSGGAVTLVADDKTDALVAIQAKTDALPVTPKKNVALANVPVKMVDDTNHVTPETGLSPAVTISKDGAAFSAATNTPATEIANGWYKISLTQAEMNADVIIVKVTGTGADQTDLVILTDA